MVFRVRLSAPHGHLGLGQSEISMNNSILRADLTLRNADAMIGFWEFTDEFLAFGGPKVFYCCEPSFYFCGMRSAKRLLRRRIKTLRADEFAWHFHDRPQMQVLHHIGNKPGVVSSGERWMKAVTVLGNLGHPLTRNRGRQRRLDFILASSCDIFGSYVNWSAFRQKLWSGKGAPATYQGSCDKKLNTIARYHACICFENTSEPLYFTEKFPDAVRAGCIPVYHAHPTVRESFLSGAIWVDPADYGWDPYATMCAAFDMNRQEVAETNRKWMENHSLVQKVFLAPIYHRLIEILLAKSENRLSFSEPCLRPRLLDEC
jgi:hypothetical protein